VATIANSTAREIRALAFISFFTLSRALAQLPVRLRSLSVDLKNSLGPFQAYGKGITILGRHVTGLKHTGRAESAGMVGMPLRVPYMPFSGPLIWCPASVWFDLVVAVSLASCPG
jgi:hypothetical protein